MSMPDGHRHAVAAFKLNVMSGEQTNLEMWKYEKLAEQSRSLSEQNKNQRNYFESRRVPKRSPKNFDVLVKGSSRFEEGQ